VAAVHVRPDGEVWVGAANGLYRLPAGGAGSLLERVSIGKEKPDGVRGFVEASAGSLSAASRQGILVTVCFYAWAAFHYLLGSFGLARQLARVAAQRRAREA